MKTEKLKKSAIEWMSLKDARDWVASQNRYFYNSKEWRAFHDENKRLIPSNLPKYPEKVYGDFSNEGGWRGFLGERFCSYEEASQWSVDQGIKSQREWKALASKKSNFEFPVFIPKAPDQVYEDKFKENGGWGGFLKTYSSPGSNRKKVFWSFEKCMNWARKQKIESYNQWQDLRRTTPEMFPEGVPSNPHKIYSDEFRNAGGWAGFLLSIPPSNRKRGESTIEKCLKLIFNDVFGAPPDQRCTIPVGKKTWRVDMMCPKKKLVVEYDGGYYHKDGVERDTAKTKSLTDAGWTVVRVRGTDLQPIQEKLDVCLHEKNTTLLEKIEITFKHLASLVDQGVIAGGSALSQKIAKRLARLDLADFAEIQGQKWVSYEEASAWALQKGVTSGKHWRSLRKENPSLFPANIPIIPRNVYTKEWGANRGWYGFLNREIPAARLDHYMKNYMKTA